MPQCVLFCCYPLPLFTTASGNGGGAKNSPERVPESVKSTRRREWWPHNALLALDLGSSPGWPISGILFVESREASSMQNGGSIADNGMRRKRHGQGHNNQQSE